jgi:uncharacterized membrane protein YoaK (UPF0700 family)
VSRRGLSNDRLQLILMFALTFSTGISDAVGFLGLDRVFTGNMTGNVVILGMALAGAPGLSIVGPLAALLAFLGGAFLAGRAMRGQPARWAVGKTVMFATAGVTMMAVAITMWVQPVTLTAPWNLSLTAALALAMGAQAATARHLSTTDVNTVVLTTTLVGLAADSRFSSGAGQLWIRRLVAVALIGCGAVVGALLLRLHPALGVAASSAIILTVTVLGARTLTR